MKLVTIEQISKWHPDKYADQISDAILYYILSKDPNAHCGIETMVKDTTVVVAGEVKSVLPKTHLNNVVKVAIKKVADRLGYKVTKVINLIGLQSVEIDRAVMNDDGAGDQGIMVGYAHKVDGDPYERKRIFAHKYIADGIIDNLRFKVGAYGVLKGDAKCQITYDSDTDKVHTIVVSVCHKKGYSQDAIKAIVGGAISNVIDKMDPEMFKDAKIIINPAGPWTIGGPTADSGLTGRKLACDAYGPQIPIGGGAQSGKDFTKVDRTAFYMAKFLARILVEEYEVNDVRVELAYVIGLSQPASVSVYSSKKGLDDSMTKYITDNFVLTPSAMIATLGLMDEPTLSRLLLVDTGYGVLEYFDNKAIDWLKRKRDTSNAK